MCMPKCAHLLRRLVVPNYAFEPTPDRGAAFALGLVTAGSTRALGRRIIRFRIQPQPKETRDVA